MESTMAWTEITRRDYRRSGGRYASDLTDGEWALLAPFMPAASAVGRPRETDLRAVMNALLYIASTGCQWRQLPREFPPYSTVQGYFYAWSREGRFAAINCQSASKRDPLSACNRDPLVGFRIAVTSAPFAGVGA